MPIPRSWTESTDRASVEGKRNHDRRSGVAVPHRVVQQVVHQLAKQRGLSPDWNTAARTRFPAAHRQSA